MSGPTVRFVNRVYPPTPGATGVLLAELAEALVERGWRVEVVTGDGGGDTPRETVVGGVHVTRTGSGGTSPRGLLLHRALRLVRRYPALLRAAGRRPYPDVLVLMTDPPMLVAAAAWLRRRTGARVVHWAQDVYPEVAIELGVLARGGLAARVLARLARRGLRACDSVIAIGQCMKERLEEAGVGKDRIAVIPNWAVAAARPDEVGARAFRAAHGLGVAFVVMYAGNMGRVHPFAGILDAAARLRDDAPDVRFVLVGDGPQRESLAREVEAQGLTNVLLLMPQPAEQLGATLGAADLHLVTLAPGLEGLVVPSKVYGVQAVGRPFFYLGAGGTEAAHLAVESGGEVLSPEDGDALAAAVVAWRADPARRAAVVPQGRYVADAVEAFERVLRG